MPLPAAAQEALSHSDTEYWFVSEGGAMTTPNLAAFDADQAQFRSIVDPMEAFHLDSYGLVVSAFLAARNDGYSRVVISVLSGESRCLELFDLRPDLEAFLSTLSVTDDVAAATENTVEVVPARMVRARLDAGGRTTQIDAHIEQILGWSPSHFITIPSIERMHPDDQHRAFESFAELLGRPGGQTRLRARSKHRDGTWKWLEITHTNLLHTNDPHVAAEALDISAEMAVQSALEKREELLALLTATLPVGVLHLDADGNADISNAAWVELTGTLVQGDLEGFLGAVHDSKIVRDALAKAQRSGSDADLAIEFCDVDATCRHGDLRIRTLQAGPAGRTLLLTLTDTTEAVSTQAKLEELARRDHLTGVLNRYGVEGRLEEVLATLSHASPPITVLYCDLNNFKVVNDTYGHSVGDSVLVLVAERIGSLLRPEDLIGRLGGDEFIAVLLDRTPAQSGAVSSRIERELAEVSQKFDSPVELSVSIGSAIAQPGDTFSTLVGRADAAMYATKSARS